MMPTTPTLLRSAAYRRSMRDATVRTVRGEAAVQRVTRTTIAETLGVSYWIACGLMAGRRDWTVSQLARVAPLFRMTPSQLILQVVADYEKGNVA